jgi:hypothetical protein
MRDIRQHLRKLAMLWLLLQAAQVAALVPVDCCVAHHTSPAATRATCHQAAPPHCPMADGGAQCPMHANHVQADASARVPAGECAMRGTCGGPFAALLVLLSNQSILPRPGATTAIFDAQQMTLGIQESVIARLDSPDPPPPRA